MNRLLTYGPILGRYSERLGATEEVLRANYVWTDAICIAGRIREDASAERQLYTPDPDLLAGQPKYDDPADRKDRNSVVLERRMAELVNLVAILKLSGV